MGFQGNGDPGSRLWGGYGLLVHNVVAFLMVLAHLDQIHLEILDFE